jgi:DNA-binding response OmpR family regulator
VETGNGRRAVFYDNPYIGTPMAPPASSSSGKTRVLFVEDEASLRTSYQRYFVDRYEMAFAGSGSEGLEQLRRFGPDVLVLDLRLPDTDGVALLQDIRQTHPRLPVVVTTAYMSMEPLMSVLDLDHSAYLLKPFDLNELAARIDGAA